MSPVIRISDELYKRLEAHASGFDTPSNVIETVLNAYEYGTNSQYQEKMQPANRLEIVYIDGSEMKFKNRFLTKKKAVLKLYYTNGISEIKEWEISKFNESSSVNGNLRSGYLRDWKIKGIFQTEVAIDRDEIA